MSQEYKKRTAILCPGARVLTVATWQSAWCFFIFLLPSFWASNSSAQLGGHQSQLLENYLYALFALCKEAFPSRVSQILLPIIPSTDLQSVDSLTLLKRRMREKPLVQIFSPGSATDLELCDLGQMTSPFWTMTSHFYKRRAAPQVAVKAARDGRCDDGMWA